MRRVLSWHNHLQLRAREVGAGQVGTAEARISTSTQLQLLSKVV